MAKLRVTIIDEVKNRRLKVDLPDDAELEKLLPALAKKLGLPPADYQLTHEATGRALGGDQTLVSFGVREGDALRLAAAKKRLPVPAWVGVVVVVLLAVAALAVWAIWRPKPGPAMGIKSATPTPTSIAISQPTATPVDTPVPTTTPLPTATPVPPTDMPVPPEASGEKVVIKEPTAEEDGEWEIPALLAQPRRSDLPDLTGLDVEGTKWALRNWCDCQQEPCRPKGGEVLPKGSWYFAWVPLELQQGLEGVRLKGRDDKWGFNWGLFLVVAESYTIPQDPDTTGVYITPQSEASGERVFIKEPTAEEDGEWEIPALLAQPPRSDLPDLTGLDVEGTKWALRNWCDRQQEPCRPKGGEVLPKGSWYFAWVPLELEQGLEGVRLKCRDWGLFLVVAESYTIPQDPDTTGVYITSQ